jgi:hypothetical protein
MEGSTHIHLGEEAGGANPLKQLLGLVHGVAVHNKGFIDLAVVNDRIACRSIHHWRPSWLGA